MKVPLLGPSYRARSLPFSSQRTINFYPDTAQAETRDQAVMYGTPGIRQWINIGGTVGCRGAVYQDGRLYAVIETTLYSIVANGVYTSLGTIGGTDRLSMASNGTQICIVSRQAGAFIYSLGGSLQQITDPDFYPSDKVVFLDQYFVHLRQSSQIFFLSALANGLAYAALDFASAEASPDKLLSIESDNGEVWLFGETTTEVWTNTGSNDFPLARINGAVLQKGIASRDVVARIDNSVYWLGNDGVVYRATGYQPQPISTNAIDYQIAQLEWSDAYALTYSQEGHNFFVLTFPTSKQTFVYDATTSAWHERSSRINLADIQWRPSHIVEAFGNLIVFDQFSGKVGYIELDTYKEYGEVIVRTRVSPVVHAQTKPVSMNSLEIVAETGVGDGTVTPSPVICYQALNASSASLTALGYTGKLTMTNSDQTGSYTVQSNLGTAQTYAAASLASAIAIDSGTKAFEWNYTLPTVVGGAGVAALTVSAGAYPAPFSSTPIARFEVVALNNGTFTIAIYNGATQVYTASGASTGTVTMIFDAASGGFAVKINGALVLLTNNTYTVQDAYLLEVVTESAGVNPLYLGSVVSVTLVSNAASLAYALGSATPAALTTCTYPLDATLAEIQAVNPAVDALPVMSNANQTGTLTILSGRATDWETATAPTFTAPGPRTVDFGTGVKKIEWDYAMPDMGGVNGAVGWMYLTTYYSNNLVSGGVVNLYIRSTVTAGVQLTELRVFRLGVAVTGFITVTRTGRLAVTMNSTTGTFSVESSAGVAALSANTYTTTTPCIFVMNLNEATGVAAAQAGKTMSATLITDQALMTYAAAAGVQNINGDLVSGPSGVAPIAVNTAAVTDVCGQSVASPPVSLLEATSDGNPLLLLSYSDDGGRTFTNEREASMGQQGEYRTRIRFYRLGRFYQRVMRIRVSAGVRVVMISADAELEVGRA